MQSHRPQQRRNSLFVFVLTPAFLSQGCSFAKRAQLKLAADYPAGRDGREEAIRALAGLKLEDCDEDIGCSSPYLAGLVDAEGSICIRSAHASCRLTIPQKLDSAALFRDRRGMHRLAVHSQSVFGCRRAACAQNVRNGKQQ